MRPIKALGEIALRVTDLDAMQRFYEDIVGLELMRRWDRSLKRSQFRSGTRQRGRCSSFWLPSTPCRGAGRDGSAPWRQRTRRESCNLGCKGQGCKGHAAQRSSAGCKGHEAQRSSDGDGERSPPAVNAFRTKRFGLRTSSGSILVCQSRGVGSRPRSRLVPPHARPCCACPFIPVLSSQAHGNGRQVGRGIGKLAKDHGKSRQ
jgi:Glyoxalase/Bleomycin resistance protein/Dioxygenase superfamily